MDPVLELVGVCHLVDGPVYSLVDLPVDSLLHLLAELVADLVE